MYIYIYAYIYIYIYICIYTHVHTSIYIYIYIHVWIHINEYAYEYETWFQWFANWANLQHDFISVKHPLPLRNLDRKYLGLVLCRLSVF